MDTYIPVLLIPNCRSHENVPFTSLAAVRMMMAPAAALRPPPLLSQRWASLGYSQLVTEQTGVSTNAAHSCETQMALKGGFGLRTPHWPARTLSEVCWSLRPPASSALLPALAFTGVRRAFPIGIWGLSLTSQVSPLSFTDGSHKSFECLLLSWCLLLRESKLIHHLSSQKVLPILLSEIPPGDSTSRLPLPHKLCLSLCPEMIFPQNSHNILYVLFGIYSFWLCVFICVSALSPPLDDKHIENMNSCSSSWFLLETFFLICDNNN